MSWSAVVAALEDGVTFRSRVSVYLHPLAGRPILWHVLHSLARVTPPPEDIRILHSSATAVAVPSDIPIRLDLQPVEAGAELISLRAAVTAPGMRALLDGAAALVTPATIARALRAAESGIAALLDRRDELAPLLVGGEGPALASADDPRRPVGAHRVAPTSEDELIRITDRHALSDAGVAIRDRLVRDHEANGVSFVLPATTWVDADVRIGPDTMIYPGTVIEGATVIGPECVIGPYSRIVESRIGRGVELKGWNYVARTTIRNHAVLEPYVRRGFD
ncbi:MAG TPA: hypothetical protein VFU01_15845 [Gemmatimonadaceae bacterium]|nr:hypothetical protein [Gemmatimonadaceae bacterium]